ncbi:hypothetical protein BJ508DRAFT_309442 [Ascobolus immersus RN42]|uniref:Uncharacterized protein n=1 Tax=Ascobolus immersus RN42 TaxID=1160509 RepID=A0A3N4HWL3_ASCIM|nr:hypothetical protein BJ508DRAFT_309442 [Ascobolus immersus RN42]
MTSPKHNPLPSPPSSPTWETSFSFPPTHDDPSSSPPRPSDRPESKPRSQTETTPTKRRSSALSLFRTRSSPSSPASPTSPTHPRDHRSSPLTPTSPTNRRPVPLSPRPPSNTLQPSLPSPKSPALMEAVEDEEVEKMESERRKEFERRRADKEAKKGIWGREGLGMPAMPQPVHLRSGHRAGGSKVLPIGSVGWGVSGGGSGGLGGSL